MERYVCHPIVHQKLWNMYKQHVASFWTVEELDLAGDVKDWDELTNPERVYIQTILAFFASSDGVVMENMASNFLVEFHEPEVRAFYSFQIAMENIHSETYSLLLLTLIRDESTRKRLFASVTDHPSINRKVKWCEKYMNNALPVSDRIVAFTCTEGIFFSSSFCAIYWLKKRGIMPGLTFSNELISRDEGLHTDFGCEIYRTLLTKLATDRVVEIVTSCVEVEIEFVRDCMPERLVGMNFDIMSQYVEFVADRLLQALGYEAVYGASNPFDWMEMISMQGKTNFFEKRVGEYQKANSAAKGDTCKTFALDEDF